MVRTSKGERSPRVFVCYRREDTRHAAGRLGDRLTQQFGDVFMDIDNIAPGLDFTDVIRQAVGSCDVLLALIGTSWIGALDQQGRRRLDDPNDWIVEEIRVALQRHIRVLPILVDDAEMPGYDQLPPALRPLLELDFRTLRHDTFTSDVAAMISMIQLPNGIEGTHPDSPAADPGRPVDAIAPTQSRRDGTDDAPTNTGPGRTDAMSGRDSATRPRGPKGESKPSRASPPPTVKAAFWCCIVVTLGLLASVVGNRISPSWDQALAAVQSEDAQLQVDAARNSAIIPLLTVAASYALLAFGLLAGRSWARSALLLLPVAAVGLFSITHVRRSVTVGSQTFRATQGQPALWMGLLAMLACVVLLALPPSNRFFATTKSRVLRRWFGP